MNAQAKIEASLNVYQRIALVQAALAKTGISKSRRNQQQGYNFRGIDEVYDALAPLLAQHGLCILPRIISREVVERQSAKGGALFNVTVEAEFDFVAADDGSTHTVRTYGEAMDSADKATNKAMSAAYKYAALMTFAIPTEGDNDADATTHEVDHKPARVADADLTLIQQLCEAVGDNQSGIICKAYQIDALPELTPSQGAAVINRLKEKLAEKAKAETNKEAAHA